MALIIISLLVLVPLALLGWDLARSKKANQASAPTGLRVVQNPPSDHSRRNAA
jgi:hypothetical protein